MEQKKFKSLSFVLCFATVLSITSFTASAARDNIATFSNASIETQSLDSVATFEELVEAINQADADSTIEITDSFEFQEALLIEKKITLTGSDETIELTNSTDRHFIVKNGGHLLLSNLTLNGNDTGGGIEISYDCQMDLDYVKIQNCSVEHGYGGAIWANATQRIVINNSEISYIPDIAIYSSSARFVLNDCELHHNTGGAIQTLGGTLDVNNSSFYENESSKGGAIYLNGLTSATLNASKFYNNRAPFGGAIHTSHSTRINDCQIYDNTSTRSGGGIYNDSIVATSITRTEIYQNSAQSGGGIYYNRITQDRHTILDSKIYNNTASASGGGIYLYPNGSPHYYYKALTIKGTSEIKDNIAPQAYYITDPTLMLIHEQYIEPTVTWTDEFDYAYNNLDISYWLGSTTPPIKKHNVTVITRYLDDALPEHTDTYQVEHGNAFLESFEVLDGYTLYTTTLRNQPVFNVNMNDKTVSLDLVETDYTIELEFDKKEYQVNFTTKYTDDPASETIQTDWIRYHDGYSNTYTIADHYEISNLDQLPEGVILDQENRTVTIERVDKDYDIRLEFSKIKFNVTVSLVYEDGAYDNQIDTYQVPYGDSFETQFGMEQGYNINQVTFNTNGISVNRSRRTITVNEVTEPIDITISFIK